MFSTLQEQKLTTTIKIKKILTTINSFVMTVVSSNQVLSSTVKLFINRLNSLKKSSRLNIENACFPGTNVLFVKILELKKSNLSDSVN